MKLFRSGPAPGLTAWTNQIDPGIENEETRLVQAAKTNPADFEVLYQENYARVYRYLRLRTGTDEDAADLTQQVFLQAFGALPRYRERGLPFAAWLFQITRNLATDAYRRRRSTITWEFLSEAAQPATGQEPEAAIIQRENLDRLHNLLVLLSPGKRELLALRFAGGLTSREIAAIVGKKEGAVKKQLARILSSLKEQYYEEI